MIGLFLQTPCKLISLDEGPRATVMKISDDFISEAWLRLSKESVTYTDQSMDVPQR